MSSLSFVLTEMFYVLLPSLITVPSIVSTIQALSVLSLKLRVIVTAHCYPVLVAQWWQ